MRIAGRSFEIAGARLLAVPFIAVAGCAVWIMLPWPSDAESPPAATSSAIVRVVQDASAADEAAAPTRAVPANPASTTAASPAISAPETTVLAKPPVEGLKIFSQSWRRGGLGSKALMTFTLRNGNDYAVQDIEIACAFARRDGSHLTDRRRLIPDTLSMKSQKRYSGVLIGFVNVNANKAKCSLVTASRS
jgi:hypothetical protein